MNIQSKRLNKFNIMQMPNIRLKVSIRIEHYGTDINSIF